MQKECLLILLVVMKAIAASSHECVGLTGTTGEKVVVDHARSSFTIGFGISGHCPALLFVVVYVKQEARFKEYCHFTQRDGQCSSSSRLECVCQHLQQQEPRYIIKGNLTEAGDVGTEWMFAGTTSSEDVIFKSDVIHLAVRPDIDHITVIPQEPVSVNVRGHKPPEPTGNDTFLPEKATDNPVVSVTDALEEASLEAPSYTTILLGSLLFLFVVVSLVFGAILYRKVFAAKPGVADNVQREPDGQVVIELPQLPVHNQIGNRIRESVLSAANHIYEKIDDDDYSLRPPSSCPGWSDTEFDSDQDNNSLRAAAPVAYENGRPELTYQNGRSQLDDLNESPEPAYQNAPGDGGARPEFEGERGDRQRVGALNETAGGYMCMDGSIKRENARDFCQESPDGYMLPRNLCVPK